MRIALPAGFALFAGDLARALISSSGIAEDAPAVSFPPNKRL
jgi:hypothetical protein